MIRIGSLFAGIGGLELGLGWALAEAGIPHRVAWQVERDPFPRSVLARHWPEADRTVVDVCTASRTNLAPVDLICGGFPCQDLSYAGKGAGIAEGTRSGLWFEYRRLVRELRPRIVVVENVSALLARGLGIVLGDLAALGYDARWECIRASDVGAPHRRERLFVVADANGAGRERERFGGVPEDGHAQPRRDANGCSGAGPVAHAYHDGRRLGTGAGSDGGGLAEPAHGGDVADADVAGLERRGEPERGGSDQRATRSRGSARRGDQGRRSIESGVGRAPHGLPAGMDDPCRWPAGPGEEQHPWEAPRVAKGVPDRAARLKALGNAVVPQVAREVGRRMVLPLLDLARNARRLP